MESLFGDWSRRKVDPFVEFPSVEHPRCRPARRDPDGGDPAVIIEIGWQGPSVGKDDRPLFR
jgi:hypothetical protein